MTRQSLLALGVAVLCVASARGTSTPAVTLTPKNIADHPRLSITARSDGEGVRVSVSIVAKDAKTPLEVNGGYLIVKDGERLVCTCPVQQESAKHGVSFTFVIAENCLEKSKFSFTVATASPEERKNLPSGGGWTTYQFTPKVFVVVKEVPKDEAKPGEVKRPAKPREDRYSVYWLTRDPPDPKSTEYEPLLLLTRYSLEQLADDKELGFLLRDLPNAKPPAEALEAVALTVETYKRDSIWNPDGRPLKPVRSLDGIDLKKRHVTLNGVRYRFEHGRLGEAVRLLEYPEGTIPLHRVHKPGAGPAQDQTFRALRALLREQLNSELLPMTPPRVRAFVAYLGRNGIELVPGADRDEWWVVGHGQTRGPLEVKIHGFSPVVSPKWMRLVLDNTSWVAELNAPARLAMSKTVALADPDTKKPDAVKVLEEKLLGLFRQYEAPADVIAADKNVAKEQEGLLAFFKAKGVELRPAENGSNYISQMFTVGPDHDEKFLVGLNYLPPLTLEEASRNYGPIPVVVHRGWALFMVGGPGGNATKEYMVVWKKAEAAFKAYTGPDEPRAPVVTVLTPTGWSLAISADGSGHVQFGSSEGDGWDFKAATFEAGKVVSDLKALPGVAGGGVGTCFAFWLESERKGEDDPPARYTRDAKVVAALFEKALKASDELPDPKRKATLVKEYPPGRLEEK